MSIESIPFETYRRRPGLNAHYLFDLLRSPTHAKFNRASDKDSPALAFGRAFHAAVLEPAELLNRFIVVPEDIDRRTKAGKEEYAELCASGKTLLSHDDMGRITDMNRALRQHKVAREALAKIEGIEQSFFWEQGGLPFKARLDGYGGNCIVDLKTATDASARAFQRSVYTYGYHVQAAHYLEAALAHELNINQVLFVVVEIAPPYGVAVYRLDEGYLDSARSAIENAVALHRECEKTGRWPSYPERVIDLLCPAWMVSEESA